MGGLLLPWPQQCRRRSKLRRNNPGRHRQAETALLYHAVLAAFGDHLTDLAHLEVLHAEIRGRAAAMYVLLARQHLLRLRKEATRIVRLVLESLKCNRNWGN